MLGFYHNFRIQPNWDAAFREKDKFVWFHEYGNGPTQYHKLYLKGQDFVADTETCNFSFTPPNLLQLKSDIHGTRKTFQSPDSVIHFTHSKEKQLGAHLSCMDIGPSGELGLFSSSGQTVTVWETASGDVRRELKGHVGEVYSCRFFPSGLAALTAGADMQLKIWCLLTGKCAATLAPGSAGAVTGTGLSDEHEPGGHRSGVLDTGIIDRGRNVVAIDRLGWLRLWDVSTQLCISGIPLVPDAVRCPKNPCPILEEACCVAVKQHHQPPLSLADVANYDSSWFTVWETGSTIATEVSTTDALVAVGMGSGAAVQMYELRSRSKGCVARYTLPNGTGTVESCAFPQVIPCASSRKQNSVLFEQSSTETCAITDYGIYAGGLNGELACWDLRHPSEPLMKLTKEKGAASQLQAFTTQGGRQVILMVGRSDGRVTVYNYDPGRGYSEVEGEKLPTLEDNSDLIKSTLELTGIDCEPVRGLVALPRSLDDQTNIEVWTASLSGSFRHYQNLATAAAFG